MWKKEIEERKKGVTKIKGVKNIVKEEASCPKMGGRVGFRASFRFKDGNLPVKRQYFCSLDFYVSEERSENI
jgi:hypothetical protein